MGENDVLIKIEGDASGLLTALDKVVSALNNFKADSTLTESTTKGLNKQFSLGATSLRFLRWGFIGASSMVRSFNSAIKDLWQPTEDLYGINAKLARFLSIDLSEALDSFIVAQNNVKNDIQANSIPTIISYTEGLNGLINKYWELPAPIKEFIGTITGLGTVFGETLQSILTFGAQISMVLLGLQTVGITFSLSFVGWLTLLAVLMLGVWNATTMWAKGSVDELNFFEKALATFGGYVSVTLYSIGQFFVQLWYKAAESFYNIKEGLLDLKIGILEATKGLFEFFNMDTSKVTAEINSTFEQKLDAMEAGFQENQKLIESQIKVDKAWDGLGKDLNTMWGGNETKVDESVNKNTSTPKDYSWIDQKSSKDSIYVILNDSMVTDVEAKGVR